MRQHEAKANSLGCMSSQATARSREHEAQLAALLSSVEGQQPSAAALREVWGRCVRELEDELQQACSTVQPPMARLLSLLRAHLAALAGLALPGKSRPQAAQPTSSGARAHRLYSHRLRRR